MGLTFTERSRMRRARLKLEAEGKSVDRFLSLPKQSRGEPSRVLKRWAQDLTVPAGLLAGSKFVLPKWQTDFIKGAMAPDIREAGLSVARKNGKSRLNRPAYCFAILLALFGGMAGAGWWCR